MSKKGCSPDNSACKGLLKRIKARMFFGRSWEGWTVGDFMDAIECYIHWYNEQRIKVSLKEMNLREHRRLLGLAA
jgi:hypothetical protein